MDKFPLMPVRVGETVLIHEPVVLRLSVGRATSGDCLGEITEVLETGANNVFVVSGLQGEILIPDISDVVLDVDFEAKRMLIHVIEGLLP